MRLSSTRTSSCSPFKENAPWLACWREVSPSSLIPIETQPDSPRSGDYDGDRAVVIWDPQIVASYRNASSDIADVPPGFEEENFERTSGTVADLLDSAGEDPRLIVSGIQLAQMRALERPIAWVYSGFVASHGRIWHQRRSPARVPNDCAQPSTARTTTPPSRKATPTPIPYAWHACEYIQCLA